MPVQASEIIGRDEEKAMLDSIIASGRPELVAVYGRRRVGKTYLLRTYLKQYISFEFSGIHNVSTDIQLENFSHALSAQLNNKIAITIPRNWFEAFNLLIQLLQRKMRKKRLVFFLMSFHGCKHQSQTFFRRSKISGIPGLQLKTI